MLSKYVAPEQLQVEFLNKWRNQDENDADDPLSPQNIPFDYQMAIAMAAQPLAWFEGSSLPDEGFEIVPLIEDYKKIRDEFHSGIILPIGDEPNGRSWTGFQSVANEKEGFFFIFRENNDHSKSLIQTYLTSGSNLKLEPVFEPEETLHTVVTNEGGVEFEINKRHGFTMYKYVILD
ncbi:MAG: hypothetical protein CMP48_06590 [Rickettsiales bacterium]|nr:hypothetical protein [Rickettsiales bacterium]